MMPAAAIRFFDGRHPRFTQVPPSMRFSVIAAVLPNSAALIAAANAVEPEPRITRSNPRVFMSGTRQIDGWLSSPRGALWEQSIDSADRWGTPLQAEVR